MIKRRIISTKISISRQGEIKFFQVKIPFDAITLIGIETAARLRNFGAVPSIASTPNGLPLGAIDSLNRNGATTQGVSITNSTPDATPIFSAGSPSPITGPGGNTNPNPSGVPFDGIRSAFVGELKLQSCDDSNVFYATDIYDRSVNEVLDIALRSSIAEPVWQYGYERRLEKICVSGNATVLSGIYKDKLGASLNRDIHYDVFLYIWYKFEKKCAVNSRQKKNKKTKVK